MTTSALSNRAVLARQIIAYLAAHPGAQDTVEGITEWWLLHHYVARTRSAVRGALRQLVRRGLLCERAAGDGHMTFRLNPRKRNLALKIAREGSATTDFDL